MLWVVKSIYRYFLGFVFKDNVEISRKSGKIFYRYGGYEYNVICPRIRKPLEAILWIENENKKDITKEVTMAMGAFGNFHGIPTNPKLLGHKEIKIITPTNEYIFKENDYIVI